MPAKPCRCKAAGFSRFGPDDAMQDHYAALGLSSAATPADIKKAYRLLAAQHHPDRNPAPEAAARFRAVQQAYEVLGDEARREAYDTNRKRNLLDNPLATAAEIWGQYLDRALQP